MDITKRVIVERTKLPPRLIQFYTDEGVVTPISGGGTRGKTWRYSEKNLVEFGIIKQLVTYGMTVNRIRQVISKLNSYMLFTRYFSKAGDRIKKVHKVHIVYLVIYDMQKVELTITGLPYQQKAKGYVFNFSMSGRKNALVLDLTEELRG